MTNFIIGDFITDFKDKGVCPKPLLIFTPFTCSFTFRMVSLSSVVPSFHSAQISGRNILYHLCYCSSLFLMLRTI